MRPSLLTAMVTGGVSRMSDWAKISVQEFEALVREAEQPRVLVSRVVLDRLPHTFESKAEYLEWREVLSRGLEVDPRDILLVGSAATGRSLSPRKRFKVFNRDSDVDIAIISSVHFDRAWAWFRRTDPNLLSGLDDEGRRLFNQHRAHYVFDGVIAANFFLSYLPFGAEWNKELQRSEDRLPAVLRGRMLSVRIYKDSEALRKAQMEGLASYKRYLEASGSGMQRSV